MKNLAIHNMIQSKVGTVELHGSMTKEAFKLLHLKNKLKKSNPLEIIESRIEMLDAAEKLALEDTNPANSEENYNMVFRCIAAKIELMNVRELLTVAS